MSGLPSARLALTTAGQIIATAWLQFLERVRSDAPGLGGYRVLSYDRRDPGWLLADGAELSRTQYADLFRAIGTTYGVGNGTTTFNIPDLTAEPGIWQIKVIP